MIDKLIRVLVRTNVTLIVLWICAFVAFPEIGVIL